MDDDAQQRAGRSGGEARRRSGPDRPPPAEPTRALSPREALDAVLGWLADSGRPEAPQGAAVLYAFASDRMRAAIGDADAFDRALRNELYRPLVNKQARHTVTLERRGDSARATVEVHDPGGSATRFTVAIARARHGDRQGCWLLSGIAREGVDL